MRIGFVSPYNPSDRRAWSGTNFKLFETLSTQYDVTHIPYRRDTLARSFGLVIKLMARLLRKNSSADFTRIVSSRMSQSVDKRLIEDVDILFFPGGSSCLAGLVTNKPIVYLTDATFKSLYDYYPSFGNFMGFNRRQGHKIEWKALEKASRIVVSSDWAKRSVVDDYGQDASKVRVIEFGANLLEAMPNPKMSLRETNGGEPYNESDALSLLFLGVEWDRKGGDTAVDCCNRLNALGIRSRLHVVGAAIPKRHQGNLFVVDHGYLNKNEPTEFLKLNRIMASSHILVSPTKAECSPIAFCEAAAFGLPVITLDTGGLGNYVIDGVNGYRLARGSSGFELAEIVSKLLASGELESLSEGAVGMYETRLNWNSWLSEFVDLVSDLSAVPVSTLK